MPFRWKLKSHWQIDFNYYRTDCWGPKGWCRLLGHPGKAKTPLEHQKKETIQEMKDKYWARMFEWPSLWWWWWTPNLTLKNIGFFVIVHPGVCTFYYWPSLMTIEFFSNRHCFPPYENKIGNSCGVFWVDPGTFVIIKKDIWLWISPKYSHNILISHWGYLYQ